MTGFALSKRGKKTTRRRRAGFYSCRRFLRQAGPRKIRNSLDRFWLHIRFTTNNEKQQQVTEVWKWITVHVVRHYQIDMKSSTATPSTAWSQICRSHLTHRRTRWVSDSSRFLNAIWETWKFVHIHYSFQMQTDLSLYVGAGVNRDLAGSDKFHIALQLHIATLVWCHDDKTRTLLRPRPPEFHVVTCMRKKSPLTYYIISGSPLLLS